MIAQRPTSFTVLAWFLIVISGFGAATNTFAIASSLAPYPQWLWLLLLLLKLLVITAAILLLKMRKAAVWLYLAVAISEFAISVLLTGPYTPVPAWQYGVSLALNALYAFIVIRHWDKLLPRQSAAGADLHV